MTLTTERDAAVSKAEIRIQKILIDLCSELGLDIDHVQVDPRNFAIIVTQISDRDRELADYWIGQFSPCGLKEWMERVVASCRMEGRQEICNEAIVLVMPGDEMYPDRRQAIVETLDQL